MLQMKMPSAVFSYVHHNQTVGCLVVLSAQTDFALRTDLLQDFGRKLAMQFAAENGFEGLGRPWLLDESKSAEQVMNDVSFQLGEKVSLVSWNVQPGPGPLK